MSGPLICLSSLGAGDSSAKENLERGTSGRQVKSLEIVNKQTTATFIDTCKINSVPGHCCSVSEAACPSDWLG